MFPLSLHSYYSLMQATSSPAKLCRLAKELGYSGLALTDTDTLTGLWPFLAACRQEQLRPLVGAKVTDRKNEETVICLVKNPAGYVNLCHLISRRKGEADFSLLREVRIYGEGLLLLSQSLALLQGLQKQGMDLAADLGDRPTENGGRLRKWAKEHHIPAVATPSAALGEEKDRDLFLLMEAIRTNSRLDLKADRKRPLPAWLEAPAVYRERFAVWPEVVAASHHLARRCNFSGPSFGIVMPPWKGKGEEVAAALRRASYRGACKRYGTDLSEAVVERLEYELRVIDSMGFSSYFLVVRDIVHGSRAKKGGRPSRICGRGSGAASLVAYCLEITNVCPLKHNLYFARFLNPGRLDPPDIDIDFSWDERDGVLAQIFREYGSHAAMVSTIICFQPRMAIRETAKAFGLPPGEVSGLGKYLSGLGGEHGEPLLASLHRLPALKGRELAAPWPEIVALASRLIGVPRYLSVHPGGVVITPEPVTDYVPVECAAKGVVVMQWDKDAAEEAGLVKIDILGNRSLGVIRDSIAAIEDSGCNFDEEYWQPEEDLETRKTVAAGQTMGCFYIESPAMRLLQQKAGTGDFEQLVLQSSIIRPAANDFVREYVRRLHGGKWQHLHPRLAEVLDETFGLMVYQEDVSRVAVALAGFSHARADGLRKVLSKKDRALCLRDYEQEFDAGCAAQGVDGETRKKLWQMMMSFDGYSFCKPHSASYARVSFQAAWLKTHYPAEFMAAVISNQGGYYSTFAYVSEAKRLGVSVLPPCVKESEIRWKGSKKSIRVGLMAVKGLSIEAMGKIVQYRQKQPYSSSVDFWQRVQPPQDESRALIQSGALDGLTADRNRSTLFWQLSQFRSLARSKKSSPLFGLQLPDAPCLQALAPRELLRREYQVLGFLCRGHPLLLCGPKLQGRTRASEMDHCTGKQVSFAGWLLSGKLVSTKSGEVMEFLTFEDETGVVETTFFPRVYRRYAPHLFSGCPYMLWGRVEEEYGVVTLTVEGLRRL